MLARLVPQQAALLPWSPGENECTIPRRGNRTHDVNETSSIMECPLWKTNPDRHPDTPRTNQCCVERAHGVGGIRSIFPGLVFRRKVFDKMNGGNCVHTHVQNAAVATKISHQITSGIGFDEEHGGSDRRVAGGSTLPTWGDNGRKVKMQTGFLDYPFGTVSSTDLPAAKNKPCSPSTTGPAKSTIIFGNTCCTFASVTTTNKLRGQRVVQGPRHFRADCVMIGRVVPFGHDLSATQCVILFPNIYIRVFDVDRGCFSFKRHEDGSRALSLNNSHRATGTLEHPSGDQFRWWVFLTSLMVGGRGGGTDSGNEGGRCRAIQKREWGDNGVTARLGEGQWGCEHPEERMNRRGVVSAGTCGQSFESSSTGMAHYVVIRFALIAIPTPTAFLS
ncbi:hypothetical protein L210DRAFT_973391 [Boletus edulis BED1]|uniref:Uncharacterized protein n=1 Tax=Boletus edulis BED1 TaxID=1328754 RepID=A0AAD4BR11_BOLED|nr:hypothetical protein L210DRAFT_973391 [Boletus edulis BED1]